MAQSHYALLVEHAKKEVPFGALTKQYNKILILIITTINHYGRNWGAVQLLSN